MTPYLCGIPGESTLLSCAGGYMRLVVKFRIVDRLLIKAVMLKNMLFENETGPFVDINVC